MNSRSPAIILFFHAIIALSISIFILGFFPIHYDTDDIEEEFLAKHIEIPRIKSSLEKRFSRTILIVIDALRYDFITEEKTPYISKNINENEACIFKLKAEIPTVTMPRIKSLVTGTISSFCDVVINFGQDEIKSDSLIHQLNKRGDKILLFGDDTWNRLFPHSFHKKEVNVNSFFATDFYECDNTVTSALKENLFSKDWDFTILHYLGLDHIGHVEGAFSQKIPAKLNEMDKIVELTHKFTKSTNGSTLLFVTSDHGMKDIGGHGGGSLSETVIPLISFLPCFRNSDKVFNQIDFAPTVSLLLNLPIPKTSIGNVIVELIEFLPIYKQLEFLNNNCHHLISKAIKNEALPKNSELGLRKKYMETYEEHRKLELPIKQHPDSLQDQINRIKNNYMLISEELSKSLAAELVKFDFPVILFGVFLSTLGAFNLIISHLFSFEIKVAHLKRKDVVMKCLHFIFILLVLLFTMYSNVSSIWVIVPLAAILTIATNYLWSAKESFLLWEPRLLSKSTPVLFALISYSFLFISSSYVEEEHQYWYYICKTFLLLFALENYLRSKYNERRYSCNAKQFNISFLQQYDDFITSIHDYVLKVYRKKHKKDKSAKTYGILDNEYEQRNQIEFPVIKWFLILSLNRFAQKLNQSGDKWINLPDIGDWLCDDQRKLLLGIFCGTGVMLFIVIMFNFTHSKLNRTFLIFGSLVAYIFHLVNNEIISSNFINISSVGISFCLFIIVALLILLNVLHFVSIYKDKSNSTLLKKLKCITNAFFIAFTLIAVLLHKPHNVILVPICIITLNAIFSSINYWQHFKKSDAILIKTIVALAFGKMYYYFQGNSNNFTTINFNPAFIFGEKYSNFYVSGILVLLHTYSGPLCCFGFLLYETFREKDLKGTFSTLDHIFSGSTLIICFPSSCYLYVMLAHSTHLFIWSVFSPKLFFNELEVAFYLVILFCTFCIYKIVNSLIHL